MLNENKKIIHILVLICFGFFIAVGYLTYIQLFNSREYMGNAYNRRQFAIEESTVRGKITDKNGVVLAHSQESNTNERTYPHGSIYSQVIGYSSKVYGKSLLESSFNSYLLGIDQQTTVFGIINKTSKKDRKGNDLCLTIDHKLQSYAYSLLEGKKGAVVAMNPKTGEILAIVSKPDFNPNSSVLSQNWDNMVDSEDSPFVPRATFGLYPPGSTFKAIIASKAIEAGMEDMKFDDKGSVTIDGKVIRNYGGNANGELDFKKAFAVSSNVAFARIGVSLGENKLKSMAEEIWMDREIPFDINVNKSRFKYDKMSQNDMAAVAMGQGKIMVTPLYMAMITSGIANKGLVMKPYIVDKILNKEGESVKKSKSQELFRIMNEETSNKVVDMMIEVVKSGTGKNASISGIQVAGKTGTAENELSVKGKSKEHAWFIGFAPADDPQIALAVVVEYGGTGGSVAAPIGGKLIKEYLIN